MPKTNINKIPKEVQTKKLIQETERLADKIERANSIKFNILKGLVYGVSTVIGATLVAALVISILSKTIQTASDIPIVGDIIEQTNVEALLETSE